MLTGARLVGSLASDFTDAQDLSESSPIVGTVYVRLMARDIRGQEQRWADTTAGVTFERPVVSAIVWLLDGTEHVVSASPEWEAWQPDDPSFGGIIVMPGAVEIAGGEHELVARITTDGTTVDVVGRFAPTPAPEPEPRHPIVDHVLAAGGSERLADLVERRANGEILTTTDGAELLARIVELRIDELREDGLVGIGDVVVAVRKRQADVDEALRTLTDG